MGDSFGMQALKKAEEVYRELVTTKVQVDNILKATEAAERRLEQRSHDFEQRLSARFAEHQAATAQGQHAFHQQVFAKLNEFEGRLRDLEREQNKLQGTVSSITSKALSSLMEEQISRTSALRGSLPGLLGGQSTGDGG